MRILVLGDFTGCSGTDWGRRGTSIAQRAVRQVDVDNFEQLLRRLVPRLRIALPDSVGSLELEFRSIDDFHPDSLYRQVPTFAALRRIRERLLDPAAFAEAATELRVLLGGESAPSAALSLSEEVMEEGSHESDAQAIERLLGRPPTRDTAALSDRSGKLQAAVSEIIHRAVDPHVVAAEPPERELYLHTLDESIGLRMRSILHAPEFQALEASWRSLNNLITTIETDEALHVYLLDVSWQELLADLAACGGDIKASGLYRLLVEQTGAGTPGGEPWSLLIGSYEFAPTPVDFGVLAALGIVAANAGGPFLAAASPALLGCGSLVETPDPSDWSRPPVGAEAAWNALRQSPIAPWLGLALPRVLLRLPYGQDTEPVDGFGFEELAPDRGHSDYLWGNPAFVCAQLIGQAYTARGWEMAPGDILDAGDLPAHVYVEEGDKRLQACAEVYLSEQAATTILDRGLMPLLSFKGRNSVRLARFQSIASPPAALKGSWLA
jgi:type VI secretion system protein ImpC